MKYLNVYKKIGIKENEVFNYLLDTLSDSIFTWQYFVDFKKVKINLSKIEKELNLLNTLIGKENIEKEFIEILREYPKVRKVLPILIAIRESKINNLQIIDNFEILEAKSKCDLFNPTKELNQSIKNDLLIFFNDSGLKDVFQDKAIKNIVDYCVGIEVGMDTNARKNRTGKVMEQLVERIITDFSKNNNLEFIIQANQSKIVKNWNFNIKLDKANRIFDFAIFDKKINKLFLIETNYYGGGGSKLKSTAGEYQYLDSLLKSQNVEFIWITDGKGWLTAKKPLQETFIKINYVLNLKLIKQGVLKEIIC
ncbi:MAG: type II restriction endonuclease [Candidatus Micrarchaeia archaeon]|jgi:type II restriction enzyme